MACHAKRSGQFSTWVGFEKDIGPPMRIRAMRLSSRQDTPRALLVLGAVEGAKFSTADRLAGKVIFTIANDNEQ